MSKQNEMEEHQKQIINHLVFPDDDDLIAYDPPALAKIDLFEHPQFYVKLKELLENNPGYLSKQMPLDVKVLLLNELSGMVMKLCPQCGSDQIKTGRVNVDKSRNVPPRAQYALVCHTCGYQIAGIPVFNDREEDTKE